MNTENTGFIAGCCNHSARTQAAYDDRLSNQFRIVETLNRCVKRIHIYVDDRALR